MLTRRRFLSGACSIAAGLALPLDALATLVDVKQFTGTEAFRRLLEKADLYRWRSKPIGEVTGAVALALLDTPYVGRTLELYDDREVCAVNLSGLDCATLYEASLAFARMLKLGGKSQTDFVRQVQTIRYRDGHMDGYVSRLHYASDYFWDNDRRRTLRIVTGELPGAEPWPLKVGFMTSHPSAYRQLKSHPELLPAIAKSEADINARRMTYLPKERIEAAEPQLKTGDILGLVTTAAGLDCSHTGLAYRDEAGVLRFLHASSVQKKVVLGERLSNHLAEAKSNTGIIVARPLEPR